MIQDGTGVVALAKSGAGTLLLTNASTFSGGTTINAGTLQLGNGTTNGSVGAGAITNNAALVVNNATVQTITSGISGTGTLAVNGAAVLTLSGSNSYSGGTTIGAASTLQAGSGTALGVGTVALSGQLDLNGQALAIGPLSGTGGISSTVAGAASVTTTIATGTSTFGGVIQDGTGVVALAKSGAGTLLLTNASTFSGGTTINAGTLQLGNGTTNGSVGAGAITNNGALVINNANVQTITSGISGTGTVVLNGAAAVTFSGHNTWTGATTINAGTLALASTGTLGNTAITVASGTTFAALAGSGANSAGTTGAGSAGATLTLNSGAIFSMNDGAIGTFNLQQNTSFAGTGLALASGTLNFDLNSGGADLLANTTTASVSGTNTIGITTLGSSLTNGQIYNLITASSGLTGTFQFANGFTTKTVVIGITPYSLTLLNSATAEQVRVAELNPLTWTGQNAGTGVTDTAWTTSVAQTNWANGPSPAPYVDGVAVVFQDTNTVSSSNVAAASRSIVVQAGGVAPAAVIFNNSAVDYTISNASGNVGITGLTGITKAGTGKVTLSGANTYSGQTSINGGTLSIDSSASLGDGSVTNTIAIAGGTLQSNGANLALTTNQTVALGIGGGTVDVTSTNLLTIPGVVSGSTGLTKIGTGTLVLSGANTFGGGTTITAGTLQLGDGTTNGTAGTGAIIDNATLALDNASAQTIAAGISGSGNVVVMNAGSAVTLSGANSYSGGTTVATASTLRAGAGSALGTGPLALSGHLDLNGTALIIGALSGSSTGVITSGIAGAASITTTIASGSSTFAGVIQNGSGVVALTKSGLGTQVLTNASTFTGGTTINAGTLQLGDGSTNGSVDAGVITNNATLAINNGSAQTLAAGISGPGNVVVMNAGSAVTLSGANSYSGGTTVNAASALRVGSSTALGSGTVTLNGQLDLNGNALAVGVLSGPGTGVITSTAAGAASITTTIASGTSTFAGVIQDGSGVVALTKSGLGTQILSNANTFTGGTTISAGTLTLASTGSLGNTAITVSSGATFAALAGSGTNSAGTTGAGSSGAALTLNSGSIFTMNDSAIGTFNLQQNTGFVGTGLALAGATVNFDLNSSGADLLANTTAAAVSGNNTVSITTLGSSLTSGQTYNLITAASGLAGTFKFANGFTTKTLVLGGTAYSLTLLNSATAEQVRVAALTSLTWTGQTAGIGATDTAWTTSVAQTNFANGASPTPYVDGAVVTFQDTNTVSAGNVAVASRSVVVQAAGVAPASVAFNNSAVDYTVSNASGNVGITGSTGITKTGTGEVTLSGANTYSGQTSINGGTLSIDSSASLGDGSATNTIAIAGGTLQSNGPIVVLTANQTVALGIGGGTVDVTSTNLLTIAGVVSGGTGLTKTGAGTLLLSGANTFSGGTTIPTGIVKAGSGTALGSGPVSLSGQLDLNGQALAIGALSGSSTGVITSGIAGPASINTTIPSGPSVYSGVIQDGSGIVSLAKSGAGTLVLNNTNTFSGGTTINAGILQLGDGTTNGTVGTGAITNNAALVINNASAQTITSDISGSGGLIMNGAAALTLSGTNSYSGSTVVNSSSLTMNSLGSGPVSVAGVATLNLLTASTTTYANAFSGDGLVKIVFSGGSQTTMDNFGSFTGTIELANTGANANKWSIGTAAVNPASNLVIDNGSQLHLNGGLPTFNSIQVSGTGNSDNRGAIRAQSGTLSGAISLLGNTTFGAEGGTIAGNISSGVAGTQTLTLGGVANGNITLNGAIGGGTGTLALLNNTTGVTTLTGASTYSGGTLVSKGTLLVNNATGSGTGTGAVSVLNAGSVLGGTGTIGGNTVVNYGASLLPGDPAQNGGIGSIAFGQGLTLGANSSMILDLGAGNSSDHVSIAGLLTLDPASAIKLVFTSVPTGPATFDLLSWGSLSSIGSIVGLLNLPVLTDTTLAWDTSTFNTTGDISLVARGVPAFVQFAASQARVREAAGANTTLTVAVQLDKPAPLGGVSVPINLTDTASLPSGTAVDFSYSPATVTIAAGQRSASFTVTVHDDAYAERIEDAVFTLGTPTGANLGPQSTFTLTIDDNDSGEALGDLWTLRNPLLTNETLKSVATLNGTLAAVGSTGTLLTSTDGAHWTKQTLGITTNLHAITAGNSEFVAVGDDGVVLTSPDGAIWTQRNAGGGEPLMGVVWTGSQFVTVGANGNVFTSVNGFDWDFQVSGVTTDLESVAFAGGQLVAVGTGGVVITSGNGTVWTSQTSGTPNDLHSVTSTGSLFVAVGDGGVVRTSSTGIGSWSSASSQTAANLLSVHWNGSLLIAAGAGGTLSTSADGSAWSLASSGVTVDLEGGALVGGKSILLGAGGTILTSVNGTTWSDLFADPTDNLLAATSNGTLFVAVGASGRIMTSPTGGVWTSVSSPTSQPLAGVAFDPNKFVAVGGAGTIAVSDSSGATWTSASSPVVQNLNGVAFSGTAYCAVGDAGTVITSSTGASGTWTSAAATNTTENLLAVASNGTNWVAVGTNGVIITSTDGSNWTDVTQTGVPELNAAIVWTGSQFMVAGNSGTVLTSPDGLAWTRQTTGVSSDISGLTWTGSSAYAVMADGQAIRSSDGITWTKVTVTGNGQPLSAIAWNNSRLAAVGASGSILTTDTVGAPPASFFPVIAQTVAENAGVVEVVVNLSVAPTGPVTVPFSFGGTAPNTRFSVTASPLTFDAGETSKSIFITVNGDALAEPNQTVVLTLGTPSGGSSVPGTPNLFTLTLTDSVAPTIAFNPASQNQIIPLGQPASLTVTTGGTVPFVQWLKNAVAVVGATGPTYTIPAMTAANVGKYTAKATNLAGTSTTSGSAELSVVDTTAKTVTALTNTSAILKAVAAGDGLTYQWYKVNGAGPDTLLTDLVKYTGMTTASLTVKAVNGADDQGQFYCDVIQLATSQHLHSGVFTLAVDHTPTITLSVGTVNQMLPLGSPVSLVATDTGIPTPTVQWLKNAVAVAGATNLTYTIPALTILNAGKYTAKATNPAGTATTTGSAEISVVDTTDRTVTALANSSPILKAVAAGNGLTYQWFKGATQLTDAIKYGGLTTASLTVKLLATADEGQYHCVVTQAATSQTLSSGNFSLFVAAKPTVNVVQNFPTPWKVGSPYTYQVLFDNTDAHKTPTTFTATGLPPGLTINATTGVVSGRPTTAGTYALVKITASNAAGANPAAGPFTIVIQDYPAQALGTFVGLIDRSGTATSIVSPATPTTTLGARFDLTTLKAGTFSGKVTVGATIYAFTGLLDTTPANPTGTFTITRTGKTPLVGSITLDTTSELVSGTLSDGNVTSPTISGWHSKWTTAAPTPLVGLHNFIADPAVAPTPGAEPEGTSYASATVVAAGTTTVSGKTADGTAIVTSAPVGPTGQVLVYQPLYTNTGSIIGTANIANDAGVHTMGGSLTWSRAAQTLATVRAYKAGWATPINLTVLGGLYHPATTGLIVMNLAPTAVGFSNAQLAFGGGGIDHSFTNPDCNFRITTPSVIVKPVVNPGAVVITAINNLTGAFNGTFSLVELGGINKRTAIAFQGLIIPNLSTTGNTLDGTGHGFFLLPQLPSSTPPATTLTTSPILSGQVNLLPFP